MEHDIELYIIDQKLEKKSVVCNEKGIVVEVWRIQPYGKMPSGYRQYDNVDEDVKLGDYYFGPKP